MSSPPLVRPTVLLVDDDADMRLYLRGCLRRLGVAVLEAATGQEALALAAGADLVVSDIVMQGVSGVALCQALKADDRTRHIPVLLISGEALAPPADADGFLLKPFNAVQFGAVVERMLRPPPQPSPHQTRA